MELQEKVDNLIKEYQQGWIHLHTFLQEMKELTEKYAGTTKNMYHSEHSSHRSERIWRESDN